MTSGDRGNPGNYSESREAGNEAAYAYTAGVRNTTWDETYAALCGEAILVRTLVEQPQIRKFWLRLPHGTADGHGFSSTGNQSLTLLYSGHIETIDATDGSASYSLESLKETIVELLNLTQPTIVRAQDYKNKFPSTSNSDYDHADHLTSAKLVNDVLTSSSAANATLIG